MIIVNGDAFDQFPYQGIVIFLDLPVNSGQYCFQLFDPLKQVLFTGILELQLVLLFTESEDFFSQIIAVFSCPGPV